MANSQKNKKIATETQELHGMGLKNLPWFSASVAKIQVIARSYVWLIIRRIKILPRKHRITRNTFEKSSVVQCFRGKKHQLITKIYVVKNQGHKNVATETQNYTEWGLKNLPWFSASVAKIPPHSKDYIRLKIVATETQIYMEYEINDLK